MTSIRRRVLFLAIFAAAATACGGNASVSPTAPSAAAAGASGAVIIGQVSGASQTSTPRDTSDTFRTLATSSIIVKITGTNISTTTDGQGQFTLTGVPPGNVQLEFSGQGTNARIVITGVGAQDEITISVTLNGNNAHVDSEHRSGRDDRGKDHDLSGPVASLNGTCPSLAFIVQGSRITTGASTVFEGVTCANLKNGAKVTVAGAAGADGTIAATRVHVEDSGRDQNEVSGPVSGLPGANTCPNLQFMVKDTKVTTTASTVFGGVTCANLKNGAKVEVTGPRGADGSIAATRVDFDD